MGCRTVFLLLPLLPETLMLKGDAHIPESGIARPSSSSLMSHQGTREECLEPRWILWALTREVRMGPKWVLGALGALNRHAWGIRGSSSHMEVGDDSWGHMEVGVNEAFTVRCMVTDPIEERGGDQRYSLHKGSIPNMGMMLSSNCVPC